MTSNIYVVIMAGGSGTRFWPHSRDSKPKQFIDVIGLGRSLLQMTFDRFLSITTKDKIWIVSNEKYEQLIREQLPELESHQVLLEPDKRNTAPCVAYAAYKIMKKDPDAVLVVSPADHVVLKEEAFIDTIKASVSNAENNENLITIGIKPHRPETGYGYIQYINGSESHVKKVKTFTEKPELELAQKFLDSGDFLWNAGIFVWSIDAIIKAFEKYDNELATLFASGLNDYYSATEKNFIKKAYSQCKSISIDYAIMEKADNVYVIPAEFGWSDLGSWNALHEIKEKDEHENVIDGAAIVYNSKDNYIKTQKNKVTVLEGLEGFLIADFKDVLLICKKEDATIWKNFIADVRAEKGEKFI